MIHISGVQPVFQSEAVHAAEMSTAVQSRQATVWSLIQAAGRPTLYPSVDFDSMGRRCHFWVRKGRVIWSV